MNNQIRAFKLFVVNYGKPTINILEYINNNIDLIKEMGIYISIVCLKSDDIDADYVEKLKKNGIHSIPCLITDNNKKFNGTKKIKELFDDNFNSYQKYRRQVHTQNTTLSDVSELSELWGQDLNMNSYDLDAKTGFKETGMGEDVTDNFNKKLTEQLMIREKKYGTKIKTRDDTNNDTEDSIDRFNAGDLTENLPETKLDNNLKTRNRDTLSGSDDMFEQRFMENAYSTGDNF